MHRYSATPQHQYHNIHQWFLEWSETLKCHLLLCHFLFFCRSYISVFIWVFFIFIFLLHQFIPSSFYIASLNWIPSIEDRLATVFQIIFWLTNWMTVNIIDVSRARRSCSSTLEQLLLALAQTIRVTQSLLSLYPGAECSCLYTNVLDGSDFQKRPVSSILYTRPKCYLPSLRISGKLLKIEAALGTSAVIFCLEV